jgi:hypothetical protein
MAPEEALTEVRIFDGAFFPVDFHLLEKGCRIAVADYSQNCLTCTEKNERGQENQNGSL